jgi:hypothetical protein
MQVNQRFEYVEGAFDTAAGEIKCVVRRKHLEVELCFVAGMNIPFCQIKLYSSGLRMDAEATYDDAVNLGKEIARRWNECTDKQ